MMLTDRSGVLLRVNAAFAAMLGSTPGRLAGRRVHDLTLEEDVARIEEHLAAVRSGDRDADRLILDKRYRAEDSRTVWAHLAISAVRDEEGRFLYFVTQAEDMTELRRAHHTLEAKASTSSKELPGTQQQAPSACPGQQQPEHARQQLTQLTFYLRTSAQWKWHLMRQVHQPLPAGTVFQGLYLFRNTFDTRLV